MKRLTWAWLFLFLVACAPLQITSPVVTRDTEYTCITWDTSYEAECKVTYCLDGLCYTSPMDTTFKRKHCASVPRAAKTVTLTAVDFGGGTASVDLNIGN